MPLRSSLLPSGSHGLRPVLAPRASGAASGIPCVPGLAVVVSLPRAAAAHSSRARAWVLSGSAMLVFYSAMLVAGRLLWELIA
jgi:hypothetical protein